MKKLMLMIALMISVTGFSQNGKEIFQNKQSILERTSKTNKGAYKHAKEIYQQVLSPKKPTTIQSSSDKASKQCLDSVIYPNMLKEFFSYDNKGNIVVNEEHEWNYSTNAWTKRKKEFEYDANGNLTQIASYLTWLDFDWTGETKYEYSYNIHGQLTRDIYYQWDFESNDWMAQYKREFSYDDNGNNTLTLWYHWTDNAWVDEFKDEFKYDAVGNLILEIEYIWENNTWIEDYKTERDYDANGNNTLTTYYYWNGNSWKFDEKIERTFDAYGNITTYIDYYWGNNTWIEEYKFKYENTYDDSGNLIGKAQYRWGTNNWTGWRKNEWAYDVNGNLTMEASYEDLIDNIWIGWSKYEYMYDSNGNLTTKTWSSWHYGINNWLYRDKSEFEYDPAYSKPNLVIPATHAFGMNNMRIEEKRYWWSDPNWSGESILTYYWSEKEIEVGISGIISNLSITIYPNPVSNILYIKTGNTDAIPSVKIYSIMGVLLLNSNGNQIDVSSLTSGIYIVEVDGIYRKIVKQ